MKNPYLNAVLALAYIVSLVAVVFQSSHIISLPSESIFYPIFALSTLVFSVSLMALLFFYQPLRLLIAGHPDEGLHFFVRTIGAFLFGIVCVVCLFLLLNGGAVSTTLGR
jgi:membrane protease YdiL (CAAX protease family)